MDDLCALVVVDGDDLCGVVGVDGNDLSGDGGDILGDLLDEYLRSDSRGENTDEDLDFIDPRDCDLSSDDICGGDLCGDDLCGDDLCGDDVCSDDLCGGDLCSGDLCSDDICGGDLCGDLTGDDFDGVELSEEVAEYNVTNEPVRLVFDKVKTDLSAWLSSEVVMAAVSEVGVSC